MKKDIAIRIYGMAILLVVAFTLLVGWGPERDTSDYNDPSTYPDYPQFNSTKNHPVAGFTPDFASIGEVQEDGSVLWNNQDFVNLNPGSVYEVYVFYQNDALDGTHETDSARVWVDFPALIRAGEEYKGNVNISANNTIPQSIWSTITMKSERDVLLRYVRNSARIVYTDSPDTETYLPNEGNDLFIEPGQLIGDNLDGKVLGGHDNSACIYFKIIVDYPDFEISTSMRNATTDKWEQDLSVKIGDRVWIRIEYRNIGSIAQENVVIKNILSPGMTYIPGSSYIVNSNYPAGCAIEDGVTYHSGINIGNYAPRESAIVFLQVEFVDVPFDSFNNTVHVITANGSRSIITSLGTVYDTNPISGRVDSSQVSREYDFSMNNAVVFFFVSALLVLLGAFVQPVVQRYLTNRAENKKERQKKQ